MKARAYIQEPDDGFVPLLRVRKIACCDCGLIHLWELTKRRLKGKTVYGFRIRRDNRATAQYRRHHPLVKP